jgi:hypothetical protein
MPDRVYTGLVNVAQTTLVNLRVRFRAPGYHKRVPAASEELLTSLADLGLEAGELWWGPMALFPWKAAILIREITRRPPRLLLDVGAGTSSRLFAALGRKYGFQVVTLENHGPSVRTLMNWIRVKELDDVISVQHCALIRRMDSEGRKYRWYNANLSAPGEYYDYVFVDGPVSTLAGRYGALPEIAPYLATSHRIFLDDYTRNHEREGVQAWSKKFPSLEIVPIDGVKGLVELRLAP